MLGALPTPANGERKRTRGASEDALSALALFPYLPLSRTMHSTLHGPAQPDLLQLGSEDLDQPLALGCENFDQPLPVGHEGFDQPLGCENLDQPLAPAYEGFDQPLTLGCENLNQPLALGHAGFDLPLLPGYEGFDLSLPMSLAPDRTLQGIHNDFAFMEDQQHLLLIQVGHLWGTKGCRQL